MPRLAFAPVRYAVVGVFILLLLWYHRRQFHGYDNGSGLTPLGPDLLPVAPESSSNKGGSSDVVAVGPPGKVDHVAALEESENEAEIVVASMKHEDTSWFARFLPDWRRQIYVVDDASAPLTVPKNKGREAMVILTYLIDRYDTLPKYVIFHHSNRFAWHNDSPDYDDLPLLQRFNFTYLGEQGYVNLRCVWILGCPAELHPVADEIKEYQDDERTARKAYAASFRKLFPGEKVPLSVGVPCCSQFGVSREAVRRHTKEDYMRYRAWLLKTDLIDGISGRVLEYAWHIIFGKNATHCPSAKECYCRVYGMCDMEGCNEEKCEGWYTLPKYASLPKDWPRKGWKGEDRGWVGEM